MTAQRGFDQMRTSLYTSAKMKEMFTVCDITERVDELCYEGADYVVLTNRNVVISPIRLAEETMRERAGTFSCLPLRRN